MAPPFSGGRKLTIYLLPRHVEVIERLGYSPRRGVRHALDKLCEQAPAPQPDAPTLMLCPSCEKLGMPNCPACLKAWAG